MNRSDDLFPPPGGTPDPYWQRVFNDATDTPPNRVWEGVERQLDLDEADGILPLWQHRRGRQSMLFGRWAAGIAASLLLTALGWWAWHREGALRPDKVMAVISVPKTAAPGTARPAEASGRNAEPPALPPVNSTVNRAEATKIDTYPTPRLADATPTSRRRVRSGMSEQTGMVNLARMGTLAVAEKPTLPETVQAVASVQEVETNRLQEVNGTLVFTETITSTRESVKVPPLFRASGASLPPPTMSRSVITRSLTVQSFNSQLVASLYAHPQSTTTMQPFIGPLSPTLLFGNGLVTTPTPDRSVPVTTGEALLATKRVATSPTSSDLLAKTEAAQPVLATSEKRRRLWLSAGVTASAFNPAVAVRSAFSPVAANAVQSVGGGLGNTVPTPPANLQSGAGRAVAFQAGIGIPLGERWSVETGVGYLSGQNEVQSPARISSSMATRNSGTSDNLYTDLLTRSVGQPGIANGFADATLHDKTVANQATDYLSTQQQGVSNSYAFVQVPVQVGYELRPRRKFGLALLTGLVSNWFVKNTVAETITVKPGDGVYRPVTMAGTAGMRLRYRPDTSWSASVAGTFQHSLQSLTRSDVGLQANPQQIGLSFSVDRHF